MHLLKARGELLLFLQAHHILTLPCLRPVQVLPLGASKGTGVAWLLQHLGVDAAHVMALGDGENDLEMLQMAGVSAYMHARRGPGRSACMHGEGPWRG